MSTNVTVIGTIATEPKSVNLTSGAQLCTFRLANGERRYDADKKTWVDGHTNWFTVNAYRSLAVNALASLNKGDRVMVFGRLRVKQWEAGEKSGTSVEIDAEALGPELRWGTTKYQRQSPQQETSLPGEESGSSSAQEVSDSTELADGNGDASAGHSPDEETGAGWFVPAEDGANPFGEA